MAEPIVTQHFQASLGEHEGLGIVALPDYFSSGDTVNVRIDEGGTVKAALGFSLVKTGLLTDTGGNATRCHGLFQYKGSKATPEVVGIFHNGIYDDNDNARTDATEYEIHRSTDAGATWAALTDLGTHDAGTLGGPPGDFATPPSAFEYKDKLYIAIRKENPQVYNGTTCVDAGPTQSPTPSLASGATGDPTGNFEIRLVSMIADDRQAGSVASSVVALDREQGDVTWTADTNTSVTGYEVYATTGTGKVFYFIDYVDGRTTAAYTFDKDDKEIRRGRPLDRHGNAPQGGVRVCALHKDRGWWANEATNFSRVYFSDPFQPDEVSPNSFFDIGTAGEQVVGLKSFNDVLYVFMETEGVYQITGTGEYFEGVPDYTVRKTNAEVGCASHQTIVEVPAGATYSDAKGQLVTTRQQMLAYLGHDMTVRLFDGNQATVISAAKTAYFTGPGTGTPRNIWADWKTLSWAQVDEVNHEITWFVPSLNDRDAGGGDVGWNSVISGIQWNWLWGAWTELNTRPYACGVTMADNTLLTGSNGVVENTGAVLSAVYQDKNSNNYAGTGNNITAEYWTKPLVGFDENGQPALNKKKRWRRCYVLTGTTAASQSITVGWYRNFQANDVAAPVAAGSQTIDMQRTVAYALGTNIRHKVLLKGSGGDYVEADAIRLRISDTSDDDRFEIPSFAIQYQILPGEKGR